MDSFDPEIYLDNAGQMPDSEIDLAGTALALAALSHPGLSLGRYFTHLEKLAKAVTVRYAELLKAGGEDDILTRLAALKHVISEEFGYEGDRDNYDDLQNADLIRVIDRGRGLPITLAILYIHCGRAQGWNVEGLNMPGHFLCRIEETGERLIFDPFNACDILQAADLRRLLKQHLGNHAELSANYYAPCSNRDILMRLQNNLKYRLIDMEDYASALGIVRAMKRVNPEEFRLLLDEGVLSAKTDRAKDAITALESYIERAPDPADKRDAEIILRQIRQSLH